jgi:D-arginine dehydrogenase
MSVFDVAIIGAGIAGASLAAELAPHRSVLMLEAEDQPGYHSTGRSNALWHETYGGPNVAPLTSASKSFFDDGGFLKQRNAITLGRPQDIPQIAQFEGSFAGSAIILERLARSQLEQLVPGLLPGWDHGVMEANCFDIDVAGVHAACLGAARRGGAQSVMRARMVSARLRGSIWDIETTAGRFEAQILVNASGGWADDVAVLAGVRPVSMTPNRRTITQLRLAREIDANWPFLIDVNGGFYFRPEGTNRVWLSPHDETPVEPGDVAPEELDVAIAIDRFEKVVDWPIAAVERSWAGLRTFAPDRLPVYGFDPDCPAFFWCAGQGGFGIQTAPAAAKICASLILDQEPTPAFDPAPYAPDRFR